MTTPSEEAKLPEPCPSAARMGEYACANKSQCWEPCGELGNDERYVRVVGEKDAAALAAIRTQVTKGERG